MSIIIITKQIIGANFKCKKFDWINYGKIDFLASNSYFLKYLRKKVLPFLKLSPCPFKFVVWMAKFPVLHIKQNIKFNVRRRNNDH